MLYNLWCQTLMQGNKFMPIKTVLSYKEGWDLFLEKYPSEHEDVLKSISTSGWVGVEQILDKFKNSTLLGKAKMIKNAKISSLSHEKYDEFITSLKQLSWVNKGDDEYVMMFKNNVYIFLPTQLNLNYSIYKWMFDNSEKLLNKNPLAFPILLTDSSSDLEAFKELQPISKSHPFLIIHISNEENELSLIELERKESEENIVLDKFIEFPPGFYQAGLGILSYFSQYLYKNYPDENAKVKIEQIGESIRLIVESEDGNTEIIEKALKEYELIVSGSGHPEDFTNNKELILELKSELRIAQLRLETQKDINGYLERDKNALTALLSQALQQNRYTTIEVNPSFQNNLSVVTNNIVNEALPLVSILKDMIPNVDSSNELLADLESALKEIAGEEDPIKLKNSKAIEKFKNFVDRVSEGNDNISNAIKASESAFDTFKKLAGKYNKIAEWCGMPVVPSVFTD